MGVIEWFKGVIGRMFTDDAKQKFGVTPISSSNMDAEIAKWMNVYYGMPAWVDSQNAIRTINFAKAVCSETARLVTLGIGVNLSGGDRASFLQEQVDKTIYPRLRSWVEYGCASGTIILKPNGEGVDVVTPDRFCVVRSDSNKKISGAIFQDTYTEGSDIFTKLEYHRFEDDVYRISVKTFRSRNKSNIGIEVPITATKWAEILPEAYITKADGSKLDGMLFGVFVMPEANNIDLDSPLGMSIFSGALEELKDLDIAYSRNAWEIDQSNTIELLDDALIGQDGGKIRRGSSTTVSKDSSGRMSITSSNRLPSHVHNVMGNASSDFYQQIDRPLKTTERKVGINQQLSFIGYKCGYSNGYFAFDEKTGMVTATQVESDDRRTIQLIKDIRDQLQQGIEDTIYAMSVFADLYELAPIGTYKVDFEFGDITYNYEEDRNRWYQLMMQGVVPKWLYLVKFENMSEDDARAIIAERESEDSQKEMLFSRANEE